MKGVFAKAVMAAVMVFLLTSVALQAQDGRCCYGDAAAPTCELLTYTACAGKLNYISWHEGLDCTTPCSTEDTIILEVVQEYPDEWAYNTDSTSSAEIYITTNRALKGFSLFFYANRRLVIIDSVKIGDAITNVGGLPGTYTGFSNDSVITFPRDDIITYFFIGGVQYQAPPNLLIPLDSRVLAGTCWYHMRGDSIGTVWGDDPVEFMWDSISLASGKDFVFTRTVGSSVKPTDLAIDTTTLYVTSGVSEINPGVIPAKFELGQNYPNPFNPTTNIEFAVPARTHVKLNVYNITGQKVRTLVNEELEAGWKLVTWDGKSDSGNEVGSGVYLYRVEAGDFVESKKMMLVK